MIHDQFCYAIHHSRRRTENLKSQDTNLQRRVSSTHGRFEALVNGSRKRNPCLGEGSLCFIPDAAPSINSPSSSSSFDQGPGGFWYPRDHIYGNGLCSNEDPSPSCWLQVSFATMKRVADSQLTKDAMSDEDKSVGGGGPQRATAAQMAARKM